ncbi:hypothetical protein QR98_0105100, partial [Sarcoptes scabiei]
PPLTLDPAGHRHPPGDVLIEQGSILRSQIHLIPPRAHRKPHPANLIVGKPRQIRPIHVINPPDGRIRRYPVGVMSPCRLVAYVETAAQTARTAAHSSTDTPTPTATGPAHRPAPTPDRPAPERATAAITPVTTTPPAATGHPAWVVAPNRSVV